MHGHSKNPSNLQARFIKHLSLLSFTSMSSYSSTFFNSFFPLAKNIGFIVRNIGFVAISKSPFLLRRQKYVN